MKSYNLKVMEWMKSRENDLTHSTIVQPFQKNGQNWLSSHLVNFITYDCKCSHGITKPSFWQAFEMKRLHNAWKVMKQVAKRMKNLRKKLDKRTKS
jgi:hypothetical protein